MTIDRRIVSATSGAVALAMAVASTPAAAQRSIPGLGRSGLGGRDPEIVVPKQVNPVNLLIEHRQELTLSDSQFSQVVVIKRALDSTDLPLLRKLDSVQHLFKKVPMFEDPSAQRRDSVAEARALVREAVASLRDNIGDARERAFGLLSVRQRSQAEQLAAAAQRVIDDEERRAGRGRGAAPPATS